MRTLNYFPSSIIKRRFLALLLLGGVFFSLGLPNTASATVITPPRIELEGDPGTTVTSEFKVSNDTNDTITFYTQVENFEAKDESGAPQFVQTSEGLALWTSVVPSVKVAPSEKKAIPFSIKIPRNAEPGGYFASIFVRTTPPPTEGNEVSIGARLGTLVLLRVNGDIQEGVDILEFSSKNHQRVFTSLPVELYYRFQNTGADRVKPVGVVTVKDIIGLKAKVLNANRTEGSVLPRSIRRFAVDWIHGGGGEEDPTAEVQARNKGSFLQEAKYEFSNFAIGMYTANLDITYGASNSRAQDTYRFFVFPWQLLVIVLGGLLILIVVLRIVLRRYTNYVISKHDRK